MSQIHELGYLLCSHTANEKTAFRADPFFFHYEKRPDLKMLRVLSSCMRKGCYAIHVEIVGQSV